MRWIAALAAGAVAAAPAAPAAAAPARRQAYVTRPDLHPPVIRVGTRLPGRSPGLVALAPKAGRSEQGPLLVDDRGRVVWSRPAPPGDIVTDFRVQAWRGAPVLTWWQGRFDPRGYGAGEALIADRHYRIVRRLKAAGGRRMDLHELQLTARGTALVIAYHRVRRDLRRFGGPRRGAVLEGIVQELDVATGRRVREWRSLDHVGLAESVVPLSGRGLPWDYVHLNAVAEDANGDLLISGRNTSAVYAVDRPTGRVRWRLGGRRSDYRLTGAARFALQHDVRRQPDGTITLFDNGRARSRAIRLRLDDAARTARLAAAPLRAPRDAFASSQGNAQLEPGGGVFVGWGSLGAFSEFDARGRRVLEATLPPEVNTYRAYRVTWSGAPQDAPAVAARAGRATTTVYASWNGATEQRAWRVLAGPSAAALAPVATSPWRGFETRIAVPGGPAAVAVEALDAAGAVLGRSRTVAPAR